MAATHEQRFRLGNDATFKGQVETALLKQAYVQLNTAITGAMSDTAKRKLRVEQRYALVVRNEPTRFAAPAAKFISANIPGGMVDSTGDVPVVTDTDLDTVMPMAFSVLAGTELAYFDEDAPVVA